MAPWTVAHQAPLLMEFSRQEHWSGVPFPTPEDLPYSGNELESLALAEGFFFLPLAPPGKPPDQLYFKKNFKVIMIFLKQRVNPNVNCEL